MREGLTRRQGSLDLSYPRLLAFAYTVSDSSPTSSVSPMMRPILTLVAAVLLPSVLSAQAPQITPAGDPSIVDAEIYALAVDSLDYPDEAAVILFDDGVLVLEHEGATSSTYRTVTQVLKRSAVAPTAEQMFSYDNARNEFQLNWARVVAPDGTVLMDEPVHQETSDVPSYGTEPVFNDLKQVRVSLSGVEPGSIVDVSYTLRHTDRVREGDFLQSWLISSGSQVRRSRFLIDAPADYEMNVVLSPGAPDPEVVTAGDRTVRSWTARDLEPFEPEIFAPFENEYFHWLQLGSPDSWGDIAEWYSDLIGTPYSVDDSVRAVAEREMDGRTGVEALKALHRWIAQDLRYVSVSLGDGGYVPRPGLEVVTSRAGDCKDKAVLFVALAREMGFEAYPVLLGGAGLDERLPALSQFNHMVAAVRIDGAWTYVDLTAAWVPFGEIPGESQGGFGLIVKDDGSSEEIEFPMETAEETRAVSRVTGSVDEAGGFEGRMEIEMYGAAAQGMRPVMAMEMDEEMREDFAMGMAQVFRGARGYDLEAFDGNDLDAPVRIAVRLEADRIGRRVRGGGFALDLPLEPVSDPAMIRELKKELETRRMGIEAEQVIGLVSNWEEFEITIPQGWTADLPPSVEVESPFGSYRSEYRQVGDTIRLIREYRGKEGILPPESLQDLIDFLEAVDADDASLITLSPAG